MPKLINILFKYTIISLLDGSIGLLCPKNPGLGKKYAVHLKNSNNLAYRYPYYNLITKHWLP
jgi:hypothetical protein